jgi:hypothetical protein
LSASPASLTFQDGTTWTVQAPVGNAITWSGPSVSGASPDECFTTTIVLDALPTSVTPELGGAGCGGVAIGMPVVFNETCTSSGGVFTDTGGAGGDYGNSESAIWTFCPDNPGDTVEITFTGTVETDGSFGSCVDILQIHNGSSTASPSLGVYCEYDASPGVITSTDASGCLTFQFSSNASTTSDGWTASVVCLPAALCLITAALGTQTPCVPATGQYTQEVIVTYANEPGSGTIDVNGQSFAITTSPQTLTLTGLTADGAAVATTAAFSVDGVCTTPVNFTAPAACAICAADSGTISN